MNEKKLKEYNILWERYEKAISNVLQNLANRGLEKVSIEELWIETSLPKDLILETFKRGNVIIPEEIKEILDKENIIWSVEK
ncbi:hypothetical protein [Thermosipho atlanticus]|uniref:Uncharacterized protein n=1 Tax=Thermosipho atlanticus DSM 15807 TaxID=1123380 RepID=A0A1M5R857_9BACT|nr:hypothetical protein [Thermosipho atlanticus]SHH22524.1 hypothetical protein SAMN02745199_0394 [Thermosipho atlanticus DSM 15807]